MTYKLFVLISIWTISLGACSFFDSTALAQSQGGGHHRPDGFIAYGPSQFSVASPSSDVKLSSGSFISVQAEKPFATMPLYLDAQLGYLKSSGTANYNYLSPTNVNYVQSGVNFTLDEFHLSLGLKYKFLESGPFHPYLEAGGTGGYADVTYDNSLKTSAVTSLGTDYKTNDGQLNFGYFAEAGFEVLVTQSVAIRIAYQYASLFTEPVETVKKQNINYTAASVYGGVAFEF